MYLKDKTGKEIHGEFYGPSAPSCAQVKFWVGGFKRGRTSLEDEARSGRPLDATDEEMCKKVRDRVYSDRRIQVEEIAQALGISRSSVSTILHDHLGVRKLIARWVPKFLSDEQMATRASVCSALLKRFRPKDDFLLRLVTIDETWVHYYEQENFFVCPNLKKDTRGCHFQSDKEVGTVAEEWVNGKDPDFSVLG